jgi:hypothetical protein
MIVSTSSVCGCPFVQIGKPAPSTFKHCTVLNILHHGAQAKFDVASQPFYLDLGKLGLLMHCNKKTSQVDFSTWGSTPVTLPPG